MAKEPDFVLTFTQRIINRLLALRNHYFFGVDLILLAATPLLAFLLRTEA